MKVEHQINLANTYDTNYLSSTHTYHVSQPCPHSTRCTLYDCKNQTNSYNFLQITRVHALLLSVAFKLIFDDFTLVINMYHHHFHHHCRRHHWFIKNVLLFFFTIVIVKQSVIAREQLCTAYHEVEINQVNVPATSQADSRMIPVLKSTV